MSVNCSYRSLTALLLVVLLAAPLPSYAVEQASAPAADDTEAIFTSGEGASAGSPTILSAPTESISTEGETPSSAPTAPSLGGTSSKGNELAGKSLGDIEQVHGGERAIARIAVVHDDRSAGIQEIDGNAEVAD